ncbi:hypothetical protein JEY40_30580 [Bradyrhizobium japonicum]|uniref:SH3 domain-containing protein n=1 Tax=Bradyrhizobium japonicum TaxID=375 RepID=A0ABV2RSI4_BRAJP|nr:hypothetical protein [Bradyrhizobium japonicum]UQD70293.1 hypothetical protein JEY40_30580 [Bradyrhizobium japonicum]UQD96840.1 hypothetical protein JEY30_35715 [Bradyrhizobium japonicum]WLB16926.1 hypothetical protein QIH95_33595 [Bradyrhizobium japonicum]
MSDTCHSIPSCSPPTAKARTICACERSISGWLLSLGIIGILAFPTKSADAANERPNAVPSVVEQNTTGYSQAYPAGAPKTASWCNGASKPENGEPPADFTAVTGIASVFPKFGATTPGKDGKIVVANGKTWVRLRTTKEWVLVQDQSENEIVGAHFDAIVSRNVAVQLKVEVQTDGGTLVDGPPSGRNDLMWLVRRGSYAAGAVDAVYVQIDMKTTDPEMKVVANVGADWWRSPDALHNGANNRGAGNSNWVELSTNWSTLYFFSGSAAQFVADPPPPLAESSLPSTVASTQRTASGPSPCLRTLAPR